ncbi:MAG TPA: hypothetical protein VH762_01520 [Gemmatimonadaceae bacterium]|jgi:hypothetical protein
MVEAQSTKTPLPDTRTLNDVIGALARRTPDGLLVACVAGGVVAVIAIGLFLRPIWYLTPLMLAIAAFGGWGIADRERAALGVRGVTFRALRLVSALVGGAAAAFLAIMLFVLFVGTLMS